MDLKDRTSYKKLSSRSRLGRAFAAVAAAVVLAFCVISGFAQSARTNLAANAAAGASVQMISEGKILFRQRCAPCHYAESRAQKISVGLKGLYSRSFSNGRKVTDSGLATRIEEGGKDMPGFKDSLKPGQLRALIAYIRTL